MPLSSNFREEYYLLLEECLYTLNKEKRYTTFLEEYNSLKNKINKILEETDAVCSDCERLLDKETGALKENLSLLVDLTPNIKDLLEKFSLLYIQKKNFEKEGLSDELMNSIQNVLAIAKYEDKEKQIISAFGIEKGQEIIYQEKKRVLNLEKKLGFRFFVSAVERLENLFRTKVLFLPKGLIVITKNNNNNYQNVVLTNQTGEKFKFVKYAQIVLNGEIYFELAIDEEMNIARKLNYYRVEKIENGLKLLLVQDENLFNKLSIIGDTLCK